VESVIGQIGQLIGRTSGCSHDLPVGVMHVIRSSVAAPLCTNVFVAKFASMRSSLLPFWLATSPIRPEIGSPSVDLRRR
jgi:hypothetical protein